LLRHLHRRIFFLKKFCYEVIVKQNFKERPANHYSPEPPAGPGKSAASTESTGIGACARRVQVMRLACHVHGDQKQASGAAVEGAWARVKGKPEADDD
jgi:hypothetical protein